MENHTFGRELERRERRRTGVYAAVLAAASAGVLALALFTGKYYTSPPEVLRALLWDLLEKVIWVLELPARLPGVRYTLTNPVPVTWSSKVQLVLLSIRVPRVLGVMLAGGGLAICGAGYQSVFRNPLVSESILGVSSGACFGAMLAVVLNLGSAVTYAFAFFFAAATVLGTYLISRTLRGNPTLTLVLVGTVLSGLMSAGYTVLRYIASPITSQLSSFMFWLMGSCSRMDGRALAVLAATVGVGGVLLLRQGGRLNAMSLGEAQARSLGVNTNRTRLVVVSCSTLITAVTVSICGIIGWIGLMIPQIVRMAIGPDNRRLLPCAFFTGGIFLVLMDLICRVPASGEVPIGVLSALLGTPVFLLALIREKAGWS